MRLKFYLASTLSNAGPAEDVAAYLREKGWIQTFNWVDINISYDTERLAGIASNEIAGVIDADVLFLLMPARRGSHIEMGAALGVGVPVIILAQSIDDLYDNDRPISFYHHRLVKDRIVAQNWFTLACKAHRTGSRIARKYTNQKIRREKYGA